MRALLLFLVVASPLASGAQVLTSAPPGFIESAQTVELGSVVVELITAYQDVDVEATEATSVEALARIGVLRGVELILVAPTYAQVSFRPGEQPVGEDETVIGFSDPAVGVKVALPSVNSVDLALLVGTSLPLGGGVFGDPEAAPSALLIAGTDLSPTFSLFAQGGAAFSTAFEITEWSGALTLGASVGERAGAYLELTAADAAFEPAPAALLAYGGGTFALLPMLELDARIGAGLTPEAPDVLASLGVIGSF